MVSHKLRLTAVGLLLFTLASAAQAAPVVLSLPRPAPRVEADDFVTLVRDWIVSLLAPRPEASDPASDPAQPKEGSQLDPDGNH